MVYSLVQLVRRTSQTSQRIVAQMGAPGRLVNIRWILGRSESGPARVSV